MTSGRGEDQWPRRRHVVTMAVEHGTGSQSGSISMPPPEQAEVQALCMRESTLRRGEVRCAGTEPHEPFPSIREDDDILQKRKLGVERRVSIVT